MVNHVSAVLTVIMMIFSFKIVTFDLYSWFLVFLLQSEDVLHIAFCILHIAYCILHIAKK